MALAKVLGWLAIGLLVVITAGPFLVPVPALEGTVPPADLADPDGRFVEVNGLTVHSKVVGEGMPAFVLLHGFGASVFSWREVLGPLGTWGTAVAFDRPPFGLSERPLFWEGPNPYTPEAQVELTVAMMDAAGMERAVLVGHSAGGTVALQVAQRHPSRVEALVLVSPAVVGPAGGLPPVLRFLLATPQARRLAPLFIRGVEDDLDEALRQAWHDPQKITPEIAEGYKKPFQADDWDRALWELTLAAGPTGVEERLGEVQAPVLLITGDDDRIIAPALTAALAEDLPQSELVVIPDCGHVAHEEHPEVVLQAMGAFLIQHGLLDMANDE